MQSLESENVGPNDSWLFKTKAVHLAAETQKITVACLVEWLEGMREAIKGLAIGSGVQK